MKRNGVGEKILINLCDLFSAAEIIFSRDSLWKKMQRLGDVPDRASFIKSFNSSICDFCHSGLKHSKFSLSHIFCILLA